MYNVLDSILVSARLKTREQKQRILFEKNMCTVFLASIKIDVRLAKQGHPDGVSFSAKSDSAAHRALVLRCPIFRYTQLVN